ncbi:hypothetical protein INS49_008383 [Diaporthe citri]|uniref:uncharacterized protein n=1 Tax=Diaporthe citri TaxID=83186 RepID=UPI001C8029E4|nr:uncharacterized protein INS49_008383 [Diaporthe citri]KAG6363286.1 hypothetical protein INS49_008383 [Diaporthe citri]
MSVSFGTLWTQHFPPAGPLTEANLPNQAGKVFIVTGGSNGLGYELSRQLYGAGGKVYILTRSKGRTDSAIAKIKAQYEAEDAGKQRGSLEFIPMDLMDFETVKAAAQHFLNREGPNGRLDILFNNAGTGARKDAPVGKQGHEYHFTTNVLGSYLLTRLLSPILSSTAKQAPPGSVRVTWPGSLLVENGSPKDGVRKEFLDNTGSPKDLNIGQDELYSSTKAACYFLASEFARRQPNSGGVLHIAGNPGNYVTGMWDHVPNWLYFLVWPLLRNASPHGADTWLWMGFSDEVTLEDAAAGRYAMCDGRWHPGQRGDLVAALRGREEGGTGRASEVYDWCEDKVAEFLE